MAEHNETGKEGEFEACAYLQRLGYQIVHKNWRWGHKELDIIAVHEEELVVVEVKTRSENHLLDPEMAVTKAKIRHIVAATDVYIRRYNVAFPVRFDIITVIKGKDSHKIEHIEDAFYAPVN